jgi:hypothetical protein
MPPLSKSAADVAMAAYNRQLLRGALPSVGAYLVITVPLIILYVVFSDQIPPSARTSVGVVLMLVVLGVASIPFSSVRRNAKALSAANGLSCLECRASLGGNYFALKRTGKCQRCGAKIIDAV